MSEVREQEADNIGALRFNEGKLRYDLIHPHAQEGLVRVLTKGSIKYDARNWEKGLSWTSTIASLKRHLAAIEKGEDFDSESGELHINHVQCNAHFLSAYYKIYPQGDDRPKNYTNKRIGLDIDNVLADWIPAFCNYHNISIPSSWSFVRGGFMALIEKMKQDGVDINKWMEDLPVKTKPEDIPFEPACYITSRNYVPVEVAEKWLDRNGYPAALVIQVNGSKVEAAKEMKLDIFVDDGYHNFVELNKAGITTYLFDANHNKRYDVGAKRIYSLKELK